jgi:hypothetical protein
VSIAAEGSVRPARPSSLGPWLIAVTTTSFLAALSLTQTGDQQPTDLVEGTRGLESLALELGEEAHAKLAAKRDEALQEGVLIHNDGDWVSGVVRWRGEALLARVRLKGDWVDHLEGRRWSLRVELEGSGRVLGMRSFALQRPKTRGYLAEAVLFRTLQAEGLLAPRSTFVHLGYNGMPYGVYYLQEHFRKELLESQGRREGPIVCFDEGPVWSERLRTGWKNQQSAVPLNRTGELSFARPKAFDRRRLASSEALARQRELAFERLRAYQRLALAEQGSPGRGAGFEQAFDVERTARVDALAALFSDDHGAIWHNQRFYLDPLRGVLEPVYYDARPEFRLDARLRMVDEKNLRLESSRYRWAFFSALSEVVQPDFVERIEREVLPSLRAAEAALETERSLPADQRLEELVTALRARAMLVRSRFATPQPALFEATLESGGASDHPTLDVRARSLSEVPVRVERFKFSDGTSVLASNCLPEQGRAHPAGVLLPWAGETLRFRFPADERLARLRDIQAIKGAVRRKGSLDQRTGLRVSVLWRQAFTKGTQEALLQLRRVPPTSPEDSHGLPRATLVEVLAEHSFLEEVPGRAQLRARSGCWTVEGDLVLPRGYALVAGPGTELRFRSGGALVVAGPLLFAGSKADPVVLTAEDEEAGWGGVVVLDSEITSVLEHTVIRQARGVSRGAWQPTGGVTFTNSSVVMRHVEIREGHSEDALNVVGAEVRLVDSLISGSASDAFDGDFVTGEMVRCRVVGCGGDGLDLSGSRFDVRSSRFAGIGDKALSIGEKSAVRLSDCLVEDAGIGLACKDEARVEGEGLTVRSARQFGVAVYRKKSEYGPAEASLQRVVVGSAGRGESLVQDGSRLYLNGREVPTQQVDVKALYAAGVLGN